MVRVGISVEGVTEERFVKKVLAPYLAEKSIFVTPISIGGGVNLDKIRSELKKIAACYDFVTTFYDFYGFQGKSENETKNSLEQKILEHTHTSIQTRLIPYIQMYEFEGLLFSSPEAMEMSLIEDGVETWANNILASFNNNPEAINNSPITAPSKRLQKDTSYRKTTHGPDIAELAGITKIRSECSGFDSWLTRLEGLCTT